MSTIRGGSMYFFGGPATRVVKALITVNIAVFVVQNLFYLMKSPLFDRYLGLVPFFVIKNFLIWQFVTYMFLHNGVFHLFFNMLTLFMFGNELERYWGTRRFLTYYFVTGIGAGICSWLVVPPISKLGELIVILGASGAIYGLLLAYGLTYPNRIVLLNFLLPVKVKWLVIIMGAMAFLSSLGGTGSDVAHIAHLGGMVVGYLYLKGNDWWDKYKFFNEQRQHEQLKKQFEVYYGDVRRKIEQDKKKGPTIH
jgi:membrane associated rhomboid family serine protease